MLSSDEKLNPVTSTEARSVNHRELDSSTSAKHTLLERDPAGVHTRLGKDDQTRTFDRDDYCRRAMAVCFHSPKEAEVIS